MIHRQHCVSGASLTLSISCPCDTETLRQLTAQYVFFPPALGEVDELIDLKGHGVALLSSLLHLLKFYGELIHRHLLAPGPNLLTSISHTFLGQSYATLLPVGWSLLTLGVDGL